MNKLFVQTILSLFVIAAVGCRNSMDMTMDGDMSFTIEKTLTVDHPRNGAVTSDNIDLRTSAATFMSKRGSVGSIDVRSISCMIIDVQGTPPATMTGTLSIGTIKGDTQKPIASLNKVSIADMISGMHRMDMHGDGRDMMMDIMMHQDSMIMYFDCGDQDSMHVTMRFNFDMQSTCDCMN
jgi:hypothetical protein